MSRLDRFGGRIVLNDGASTGGDRLGAEVGEELQRRMLRLLGDFTTPAGLVDYAGLHASVGFREVIESARRLQSVDLARVSARGERLAFWINVYNALVLHGIVSLRVRRTVREVWNFFGRVSYRIGGFTFSVDDIEHGVLRGNRRRSWPPFRPFGRHDPRLGFVVGSPDPRIHFAITCGARSCPPVGAYRAALIDGQLDLAARNFVNLEIVLDPRGRVTCSKIFKWYGSDFDPVGGLRAFLLRYLDDGEMKDAVAKRATPCARFRPYSWKLQHPSADGQ